MIVVGGEALVDLVIDPSGGVVAKLGGGPFNTARTIARLGSDVTFYGSIARDRFGGMLYERLIGDGVSPQLLHRSSWPTTLAAAELSENGSATYQFYFEHTAAPDLPEVALPTGATALHAGTLGFALEPMATALETMVLAAPEDLLVMLDLNCRPNVIADKPAYLQRLQRVLGRADVVKVSTEDLDYLGFSDSFVGAAQSMIARGVRVVLHTDGGDAVNVHTAAEHLVVPVQPVSVVDTIGAGDAFGGAFIAWWSQSGLGRADLGDAALLQRAAFTAVAVARDTCTRSGAEPPFALGLGALWEPRRS